ncbi:NAD-dependent epimerase/dehydratase family protein [Actinokineospora cianjurensis]|uniref:Nucleoside-diphosphate-sugar epimerase n=1 Tax=Actinokineospora cianjurensis TaxID=585224 RepID=A0A421BA47_9PSEU|nr:NAD(P)-dependent oxidoreductase [Actinokineospora cianjurensis]RLK61432.1 nucleoside-diphosphate-sugar epimerase [Actinokineospora cianjurensis]
MGEVKLSGAVMTHPKRLAEAQVIADADTAGRIAVILDPEPEGKPTALRVAPLSWSCVPDDATHHVVLQDDVVLAQGFYDHAERAAAAFPDEAVAFYGGWEARNGAVARLAALTGVEWAYTLQEHVPCQALMLPAELARGYARFQREHGDGWPYDVVIQRYLNDRGVPVRFCTPSTVQHDDLPSLAGNSYHGFRQATWFTPTLREHTTDRSPRFPVVPFYQYGEARTAVQRGAEWEFLETDRYLRRIGLLDQARKDRAAVSTDLREPISTAVWLTGFALGVVTADAPEPDPVAAVAVMDTLGPGGLCEDYTAEELLGLAPAVRDLALAAFEKGRAAGPASTLAEVATAVVTGGDPDFARQLARYLADEGDHAEHLVHIGQIDRPVDLSAIEGAGALRVVYLSSAAIYRGSDSLDISEDALGEPTDPIARAWWHEEQRVRQWGERTGVPVQVLRVADPVGPHAPEGTPARRWVHLAWTRRPLTLDDRGVHQILDHRDLADAIHAVLVNPATQPVYNVSSATHGEEELAGLLAEVSRRTPWESAENPDLQRWTMSTGLIEAELGWRPRYPVREALRALAQWYACDIHGDYSIPR